jgi:ABC-type phosphate transport system substrate-binding protein
MRLPSLAAALAVSVSTLAAANAATLTPIYAGGGTLGFSLYRSLGDCAGTPITGDTVNAACSATHPYASFEYLFAPVGSGGGLDAFLAEASPTSTPSSTPYQDPSRGFTYPYASWQFSDSDAPLDAILDSTVSSPTPTLTTYDATVKSKRGEAIQIPTVATPVTIPFNYKGFDNLVIKPSDPKQDAELKFSKDQLCFIWTRKLANGSAPPSSTYDWSNKLFYSANSNKPLLKSGETLAITPFRRPDSSGTTYLFTLWLSTNCSAYSAAGFSTPATNVTWPSWTVAAPTTGSGGIEAAVASTTGSISYVSPTAVEPAKPGTVPTGYLQTNASSTTYVEANSTSVAAAIKNISPPPAGSGPTAWGESLNKSLFNVNAHLAYPIVGVTYLDLYTCYLPTEITGVLDFVRYYTTSAGETPSAKIEIADGFAELPTNFRTAIYALVHSDSTKLISVKAGASASQCPDFDGK